MNTDERLPFAKEGRVKLSPSAYSVFIRELFALDGWTCKACGRLNPGLTCHHLVKRSRLRLDTRANCISLCFRCHEKAERKEIMFEWINEERREIHAIPRAGG